MKICFVISDIATEPVGTSVVLMKKAHERGHTLYVMGVGDFVFHHDAPMSMRCTRLLKNSGHKYRKIREREKLLPVKTWMYYF